VVSFARMLMPEAGGTEGSAGAKATVSPPTETRGMTW